jgi:hypothetical protein
VEQRDSVNVGVASCPECWTLICLDRPVQSEIFPCPTCETELQVVAGFIETLAYGDTSRIHHLTER